MRTKRKGKPVTLRLPTARVAEADQLAAWRSTKTRRVTRTKVLREAIERGLAALYGEHGKSWPMAPEKMRRPVAPPKLDRSKIVEERIVALFRTKKSASRMAIRRELNYRDTEIANAVLTRMVRDGRIKLAQEETDGRWAAVYTWIDPEEKVRGS